MSMVNINEVWKSRKFKIGIWPAILQIALHGQQSPTRTLGTQSTEEIKPATFHLFRYFHFDRQFVVFFLMNFSSELGVTLHFYFFSNWNPADDGTTPPVAINHPNIGVQTSFFFPSNSSIFFRYTTWNGSFFRPILPPTVDVHICHRVMVKKKKNRHRMRVYCTLNFRIHVACAYILASVPSKSDIYLVETHVLFESVSESVCDNG